MMYDNGAWNNLSHALRIISMSLTELSLGQLLASSARLRFTRRCQSSKTNPAAPPIIEDNVTFLTS